MDAGARDWNQAGLLIKEQIKINILYLFYLFFTCIFISQLPVDVPAYNIWRVFILMPGTFWDCLGD